MVNKRGWLRIVEAFLAIMIIFGVFLVISQRQQITTQEDYSQKIVYVLEEISRNNSLREKIVGSEVTNLSEIDLITAKVFSKDKFNFTNKICLPDQACGLEEYPASAKEIYVNERIIGSDFNTYRPKRVRIFVWIQN